MSLHPVIRRLLAGVMLFVFAFSVTPKKILHDAVAHHKDRSIDVSSPATHKVTAEGFSCKCDNLVAESPFTDAADEFDFAALMSFSVRQSIMPDAVYVSTHVFFSLRGPPAMA